MHKYVFAVVDIDAKYYTCWMGGVGWVWMRDVCIGNVYHHSTSLFRNTRNTHASTLTRTLSHYKCVYTFQRITCSEVYWLRDVGVCAATLRSNICNNKIAAIAAHHRANACARCAHVHRVGVLHNEMSVHNLHDVTMMIRQTKNSNVKFAQATLCAVSIVAVCGVTRSTCILLYNKFSEFTFKGGIFVIEI